MLWNLFSNNNNKEPNSSFFDFRNVLHKNGQNYILNNIVAVKTNFFQIHYV